jgi:gamma-glutamyltranspeptidase
MPVMIRRCTLAWGLVLFTTATSAEQLVTWKKGAVASVHPLATDAGMNALKAGGNAVDAAIATAITLGVVDGHNSGLGGGCFILIRAADGTVTAIDGREKAPALATRDMFLKEGKVDDEASKTGALASGVPGALAAYDLALKQHGKLKLADLLLPAAEIAELGTDWFCRGEYAGKVADWMKKSGGVKRNEDFATYQAATREPLRTTYRGHEPLGFPPPSSGGVHVA